MDKTLPTPVDKGNLLSKNITLLISSKGLSQAETARGIGFSPSKLNNYVSGHSKPSLDDLFKLLEFFGVTASQLLETDLAAGNLISEIHPSNLKKNSNLTGKGNSNLMAIKGTGQGTPGKKEINPAGTSLQDQKLAIFNELQRISGSLEHIISLMDTKPKKGKKARKSA